VQPNTANGQPKPAPGAEQPPKDPAEASADQDDTQRAPGQMSREEARQLLDSEKGEERRAHGLPFARRQPDSSPDEPAKDW
jgi:hypothetical protein